MDFAFWTLAFVGHGLFWVELVNRLHGVGWRRAVIDGLTQACGVGVASIPIVAAYQLLTTESQLSLPAWLTGYAWFSLVVLAVVLVSRVAMPWDPLRDRRTKRTAATTLDVRERLGDRATAGGVLDTLANLPGNRLLQVELEELTLPLERLPLDLEGMRIAHLTDLHMSGRLAIGYFEQVVKAVNAWQPDLVFLTGDLIEHTPQLEWIPETLGRLEAKAGVYYILGNHDAKIDANLTRQRLDEAGLIDASGCALEAEQRGVRFTVCGDERPWFPQAPPLTGDEDFILCLAHTPDRFGWAVKSGVDLTLAGHVHGGQVCFPLLGPLLCPSRHGVRYADGTFRRGRSVMHVGRGSGSLFPLRYNCPPEVALLTLTRG
ncbi:putative metallophosphoesterase [Planctomycetes bacterium MalM25]|nr:putative metallophosphoesterase [Planctomycetes bacterium MalM25]